MVSSQVPILLLKEGSTETKDKDAQQNNITAAKTCNTNGQNQSRSKGHGQDVGRHIR